MSVPVNLTPETATVISALPFDQIQDATDAPTGTGYASTCDSTQYHALWFTWTTGVRDTVMILSVVRDGAGNYNPRFSVWTGTLGSLTQEPLLICVTPGGNFYYQIPIVASTQYWIQVTDANNTSPVGSLRLRLPVVPSQTALIPAGSLVIPDDSLGYPAAIVDAGTGAILSYPRFAPGEFADTLPNGIICTQDKSDPPESNGNVSLYNRFLTKIASYDFGNANALRGIKSDRMGTFYVITQSNGSSDDQLVWTIGSDGTVGATHWTLPANSKTARIYALSQGNTTPLMLYYAANGGSGANAVQAFNLTTNAPASDLHAAIASEGPTCDGDGYVDEAGNVLIAWAKDDGTYRVRRFDTSGTILDTYLLTHANFTILDHFCADAGTGTDQHFWAWAFYGSGFKHASFQQVRLSDSSVTFFDGVPVAHASGVSDNVDEPYPISNSCPVFVLTQDVPAVIPPPAPATRQAIRVLRQFGPMSAENVMLFLSNLEVLMNTGSGTTTGQGSDPQLMLSWSKDYGHTWSQERWLPIGKMGDYLARVRLPGNLGQGRGWCVRVVVTDPIDVTFLQMTAKLVKGTS